MIGALIVYALIGKHPAFSVPFIDDHNWIVYLLISRGQRLLRAYRCYLPAPDHQYPCHIQETDLVARLDKAFDWSTDYLDSGYQRFSLQRPPRCLRIGLPRSLRRSGG
jgi:hypothetical protein